MKKVLLTIAVLGVAVSVFAQGTVQFVLNGSGFRAPVYGPDPDNPTLALTGNTAAGLPAGTTVYGGQLLSTGYAAQLFGGPSESALTAALPVSTFRTGSAAGLLAASVVATLVGVPLDAPSAWVQVRAWDNRTGLYPTWQEASAAWEAGLIAAGMSLPVEVLAIGGIQNTPPIPVNLRSFNIYLIPEPSTFALAGLGAAALMIFRRLK